ncbi:MAG TPA: Rieske 2Fe-2S domain-containing protein [Ktedonosporobacter sp.]|nr:Rieske 2Fe-2S domain-containing protein [Ktedonosporobacter sp.]
MQTTSTVAGLEFDGRYFKVASVAELEQRPFKVVTLEDRHILLLRADGQIRALDSRCPHMGYPLSQGTVRDGVLRCHWHHWRFDLASGGCFTEGGDDVAVFPIDVRDGAIWVSPVPLEGYTRQRTEKFLGDLRQGMEERNTFLIAKAVAGLRATGVPDRAILSAGAMHGLRFRQGGFSMGLTILTCMGLLTPDLLEDEKALADVHALINCARDSFSGPPRRMLRPLPSTQFTTRAQLIQWFRLFIEDREAAGAERILRSAIAAAYPTKDLIELLLSAATDHYFLSTGHVLDFTNKALELFEVMTADGALPMGEADGREVLATTLSAVVRPMAMGFRHEEDADWHETIEPQEALFARLPVLLAQPRDAQWASDGHSKVLRDVLLAGKPDEIVAALQEAIEQGASVDALSSVLARAGIHRVARFHVQNEEDWDDVLHVISYANAVDALTRRAAGHSLRCDIALMKAVVHGAMFVYLTHFLNIPRAALPSERGQAAVPRLLHDRAALLERLLYCAEFQQVEEAAAIVHYYQEQGYPLADLKAALGKALLREDATFHTFQMLEAGLRQQGVLGADHPDGRLALVAATRYMVAQRLRRNVLFSTQNALKLQRGEALNEEE